MPQRNVDRRSFLKLAAAGAAVSALPGVLVAQTAATPVPTITFPPLPYAENALEPSISALTVKLHYTKHHKGYYDLVTGYINQDPTIQKMSLEQIIAATNGGINLKLSEFEMSVLLWNHGFYWKSMKPKGGGALTGDRRLRKMIDASFGSVDKMKFEFLDKALGLGVGWVWLVQTGTGLAVIRTDYHDTPLVQQGVTPLLTCDVWEHAYYMDYLNDRKGYVTNYLDRLVNWEFAEKNLRSVK